MFERAMAPRRRPGVVRVRGLSLAFLVSLTGALAGCSQEGKLIQAQLPLNAVGMDFTVLTDSANWAAANVRLKIQVHAHNACELQHAVFELQRVDEQGGVSIYQMTPVARYAADDRCVLEGGSPTDTVLIFKLNAVTFGQTPDGTKHPDVYSLRFAGAGAPPISVDIDRYVTIAALDSARFDVRAEDATNGAALENATVAIDRLDPGGVATPLDSALTDSGGHAMIEVPAPADTASPPSLPYRARVTLGARTGIFSVPSFPARNHRLEKVVVRL